MTSRGSTTAIVSLVIAVTAAAGCERESRRFDEIPAASTRAEGVEQSTLHPGGAPPEPGRLSPYQENAYGMAEGKRLYAAFNCSGCHQNGGGGIGPALMDDKWIYGAEPQQIYSTIVEGRPNGMPAFGSKVPTQQVWQLVAYVQSLSGQVPKDAAPGRNDGMSVTKPELRLERQAPKQTGQR